MMNRDLRNYINNSKDLIQGGDWELLLEGSGIHTLELIQMLYTANVNELKETLLKTKNPYVFKSLFKSFLHVGGEDNKQIGGGSSVASFDGFNVSSQCASLDVDFDPDDREWSLVGNWDDGNDSGSFQAKGQGWDNLIYNIADWSNDFGFFGGTGWHVGDCYIGDAEKFPLQQIDLVHDYNMPQDEDN